MRDLSPAEMIAVAGGLNGKTITELKQSMPDDSAQTVDVTVRVSGTVTKGTSKPASETEGPATVDFFAPAVVLDIFNRLGIGPARLRDTLSQLWQEARRRKHETIGAHCVLAHPKLATAFDIATIEAQQKLPKQVKHSNGIAGRVTVTAEVTAAEPELVQS